MSCLNAEIRFVSVQFHLPSLILLNFIALSIVHRRLLFVSVLFRSRMRRLALSIRIVSMFFDRWPVHGQLNQRGWRCVQDCVVNVAKHDEFLRKLGGHSGIGALVLWSLAIPRAASASRVALYLRLRMYIAEGMHTFKMINMYGDGI